MASPSNKKDGSAYLSSLSKSQLIEKCIDLATQVTELEADGEKKIATINELEKKVAQMQKRQDRFFTKEEIIKKILEYKARNLVPITIREKMILDGFTDVTLNQIKNIYNGELSLEHEAYYKKCVEDYTETIRINTTYYKQSSIDEINRLLGYSYEDLETCDKEDIKTRQSIMANIGTLLEKRDKLMKNIDEVGNMTEEEEYLNQSLEDFKSTSDKIIKLVNVKVIGD